MRLSELRERKGISQKDIAAELGIDRTTWNKWEKGKAEPSIDMLCMLADYFGVTLDYLCEHEPKVSTLSSAEQASAPPQPAKEEDLTEKINALESQVARINLSLMMLKKQKSAAETLPQVGFRNIRPAGTVLIGDQPQKVHIFKTNKPLPPPIDEESIFPQISGEAIPVSVEVNQLAARLCGLSPESRKRVTDFISGMEAAGIR